MLQNLLAERFQLTVHRETKNGPGFSLALIKGELKIHPDETEGKQVWNSRRGKIVAERVPMTKVAQALTGLLGDPVVDVTDAKGLYSFTLEWTADAPHMAGADSASPVTPTGPSLEDVLASQLGLKLETRKLPIDLIVIDKAKKPTEN
jgi:uncharacterized protein (TIGR03435 family)